MLLAMPRCAWTPACTLFSDGHMLYTCDPLVIPSGRHTCTPGPGALQQQGCCLTGRNQSPARRITHTSRLWQQCPLAVTYVRCRAQLAVTAEYTHDMTVVSRLKPDTHPHTPTAQPHPTQPNKDAPCAPVTHHVSPNTSPLYPGERVLPYRHHIHTACLAWIPPWNPQSGHA
jgi:hypothetical protein